MTGYRSKKMLNEQRFHKINAIAWGRETGVLDKYDHGDHYVVDDSSHPSDIIMFAEDAANELYAARSLLLQIRGHMEKDSQEQLLIDRFFNQYR